MLAVGSLHTAFPVLMYEPPTVMWSLSLMLFECHVRFADWWILIILGSLEWNQGEHVVYDLCNGLVDSACRKFIKNHHLCAYQGNCSCVCVCVCVCPSVCPSHCPSWGFIAVKRHHDHSNSYKRKHLIGACLQFTRFRQLSLSQGAWSRPGIGEVAESSTSGSTGSRKREQLGPTLGFWTLKAYPHFFQ